MLPTTPIRIVAKNHRRYGEALGEIFGSRVRAMLARKPRAGWDLEVKRAMAYWPDTNRHFPRYIEEIEAYAHACGIKAKDLWTLGLELSADADRCTVVVTQDGFLIGHVEDFDPKTKDDIVLLERTVAGTTVLELFYPYTLGGNAASINSHGWVQTINTLHTARAKRGVPRNVIARWLSETKDPVRDVRRLERIPLADGYAHTFVNARSGRVLSLETASNGFHLQERPSPFVHTNHILSSKLSPIDASVSKSSVLRLADASRMAEPKLSTAGLKRLMSDTSRGASKSIFNGDTVAKMIIDLKGKSVSTWFARTPKQGYRKTPVAFI